MTISVRDPSQERRTKPPSGRGLIDLHIRFNGRHDDVGTCGRCGGRQFDSWMTEGASSHVYKCAGCHHVQDSIGGRSR